MTTPTALSLTVSFATLGALTAFVQKMGSDVQGATITHNQELTPDPAPAAGGTPAPAKGKGSRKKDTTPPAADIPALDLPQTNGTGTPFPGGPSFTPGNSPAPAPTQSAPAASMPSFSPGPSVAPMAAPQAAPAPQVSPERQQYNQGCAELIGTLEKLGPNYVKSSEDLLKWCFQQVGAQQPKVGLLTDQQVVAFYNHLHSGVTQLCEHYNANAPKA